MIGTFRQSMSWLHTWSGLVFCWLLYFVFVTGTLGYFEDEIDRWMQPEAPLASDADPAAMLTLAERQLQQVAPEAQSWWINLPAGRHQVLDIWWQDAANPETGKKGKWHDQTLDPVSGEVIAVRETSGGRTLYRLHYALHYMPRVIAYIIVSLASMFMLVALITGIVIHKKIFKDFFTFRTGKRQRSWLDIHNLTSVLPLPFHLMITYSGLMLLMFTTMPGVVVANYGFSEQGRQRFFDEVFADRQHPEPAGIAGENLPLLTVMADVEKHWRVDQLASVSIEDRGDMNAHIEIRRAEFDGLQREQPLLYHATTGERLSPVPGAQTSEKQSGVLLFHSVMVALHEGLFADTLVRWLYFLSGLLGAGMMATGSILWAVKRRTNAEKKGVIHRGLRLVENLNAGAIVGVPAAVGVYFLVNRLLPITFSDRAEWEINSLFITLGLSLCYPLFRPVARAWVELLGFTAALFIALPVVNALTTEQHLGNSLIASDWVMAGFDLTALCTGLLFLWAAVRVRRHVFFRQQPLTQTGAKKQTSSSAITLNSNAEPGAGGVVS